MSKNILLTGPHGFVGSRILNAYRENIIPAPSLRDASEGDVKRIVEESGADVILHTAAISDTGFCQNHPEMSYKANVVLPVHLAKAAAGRKLICFSSDQVYSGAESEGPYTEDDAKPANVYADHKLEMERRVLDIDPDAVMLRAEWMYDYMTERRNYLKNILEGQVSFSSRQFRGVTYLREVVETVPFLPELPGGVYNYGSETDQSMYEITRELLAYLGRNDRVLDVPPRHNLWMDCSKAAKYGVVFSDVLDGLKRCVDDYAASSATTGTFTASSL